MSLTSNFSEFQKKNLNFGKLVISLDFEKAFQFEPPRRFHCWPNVQNAGYKAQGTGCKAQGSESRVKGLGSRVQGPGLRAQGFRVPDSGFRVQGAGCGV